MKVTQDEVVDNQAVLNIELEEDDLDDYLERDTAGSSTDSGFPASGRAKPPATSWRACLGGKVSSQRRWTTCFRTRRTAPWPRRNST